MQLVSTERLFCFKGMGEIKIIWKFYNKVSSIFYLSHLILRAINGNFCTSTQEGQLTKLTKKAGQLPYRRLSTIGNGSALPLGSERAEC